MRKYKPVELPLKAVPTTLREQRARCPNCQDRQAGVVGRLGLRLVFRCESCRIRFHRPSPSVQLV